MSILLGNLQVESEIPRSQLCALDAKQLRMLMGYTQVTKRQCRDDPIVWKFLTDTGYDRRYFDAKDYELIQEVIAEKADAKRVGIVNVQEAVSSLKGEYTWTLDKTTYQLPGKDKVVRVNTVIPTERPPVRKGTAALRTYICQFYDVSDSKLTVIQPNDMIELAFGHPQCPLKPSGVRAFLSVLQKVMPGSLSYKHATNHGTTVTGVAMYELTNKFFDEMDLGDYYSLHQAFISLCIRGWRITKIEVPSTKSKKVVKDKTAPSYLKLKLVREGATEGSIMVMTRGAAKELGQLALYESYVRKAGIEPMIFVGGMNPVISIPDEVSDDLFMPLISKLSTVVSVRRGLGPVAESINYQPLQSAIGREASFLMFCYKIAKLLNEPKIDIVASSSAIVTILRSQIPESDVKQKIVNFVSLGKQAKASFGVKEINQVRVGSFVIADKTIVISPPAEKKDAGEYYTAKADEYIQVFPESGIVSATIFHKSLVEGLHMYAFKHSLNAVGILSTKDITEHLSDDSDVTLMDDWAEWIKANLLTPKRILLSSVCPDHFGSTMGNHLSYAKGQLARQAGSITDYTFVDMEGRWNDYSSESDDEFHEVDEDGEDETESSVADDQDDGADLSPEESESDDEPQQQQQQKQPPRKRRLIVDDDVDDAPATDRKKKKRLLPKPEESDDEESSHEPPAATDRKKNKRLSPKSDEESDDDSSHEPKKVKASPNGAKGKDKVANAWLNLN
jgi:hypothetical protein